MFSLGTVHSFSDVIDYLMEYEDMIKINLPMFDQWHMQVYLEVSTGDQTFIDELKSNILAKMPENFMFTCWSPVPRNDKTYIAVTIEEKSKVNTIEE